MPPPITRCTSGYPSVFLLLLCGCVVPVHGQQVEGELRKWHRITLTFDGPHAAESDMINPFADYRFNVVFTHQNATDTVPGFFAADGDAAQTSATAGNRWRVHFAPSHEGLWQYHVEFVHGDDVAVSGQPGQAMPPDGTTGSFLVGPTDKQIPDNRARGRLRYVHERYLKYAETGSYFLKSGADAPETLLAYTEFDDTEVMTGGFQLKTWEPHLADWREGDPVWQKDKGKGLIGAINYLASEGQNAFSFLTMNIAGDGRNVWPYTDPDTMDRFDCSKLDQWEVIFDHADRMGMYLHFKTQETENDQLLDGGELGRERKLYYRELVARFGHHLALNWNLGEENTNTQGQRKAFAAYFRSIDPYNHHIVVHTYPDQDDLVYTGLLGDASELTGASLQVDWDDVHERTAKWVQKAEATGKPWVVANDEQGSAVIGVPDDTYAGINPDQHDIRKRVLWGHLMAGGAGVEYYFGYVLPHSDLSCEDFRSRDRMWDYNRHALHFFETYLPFWSMTGTDALIQQGSGQPYCFSSDNDTYVIYLPEGGSAHIDLSSAGGSYSVHWYDPVAGGAPEPGSIESLTGGGIAEVGMPPRKTDQDWVVLIRKDHGIPGLPNLDIAPVHCLAANLIVEWPDVQGIDSVTIDVRSEGLFEPLRVVSIDSGGLPHPVAWQVPLAHAAQSFRLRIHVGEHTYFSDSVSIMRPCAENPWFNTQLMPGKIQQNNHP